MALDSIVAPASSGLGPRKTANLAYSIQQGQAAYAPQMAGAFAQAAEQNRQLALKGNAQQGLYGVNRNDLIGGTDSAIKLLQNQRAGLVIDQGAAGRNLGYLDQLDRLAGELLQNQYRGNDIAFTRANQAQMDDATARGAVGSRGDTLARGLLQGDWQVANTTNRIGYDREIIGNEKERQLTKDQLAKIDLEAKALGIRRDEYVRAMNAGLERMGYENAISMADIAAAMSSNDWQAQTAAAAIAQQALQAGMALFQAGVKDPANVRMKPLPNVTSPVPKKPPSSTWG